MARTKQEAKEIVKGGGRGKDSTEKSTKKTGKTDVKSGKTDAKTAKTAKTNAKSGKTNAKSGKTNAKSEKTNAKSGKTDTNSKTDSIDSMKRPEIVAALADLGIAESSVKRLDGTKGKATIPDLKAALKAAQKEGKTKDSKSEPSTKTKKDSSETKTSKKTTTKTVAVEKSEAIDYASLEARLKKLEVSLKSINEEVAVLKELLGNKGKKVVKPKKGKKEESEETDSVEGSEPVETESSEENEQTSLVNTEESVENVDDSNASDIVDSEALESSESGEDEEVASSEETKEKSDEVLVELDEEKGYGTDKRGYVYTITPPKQVVAKLVKGKVTPLTAKDITELKSLNIKHTKKTAEELKKLLIPLKKEDKKKEEKKPSQPPLKEESSSSEHIETETDKKTSDSKSSSSEEKEDGDSAAEGTEVIKEDEGKKVKDDDTEVEGAAISKHFEKPVEVTESDFKKVVVAIYANKINLKQPPKEVADKLGMTEAIVGQILTKYTFFTKKWSSIVEDARGSKTVNTTESSSTALTKVVTKVAGGRQKLVPHRK